MGKWWLCALVASVGTGCLDFDAAERAFCANHACPADGGVAPDTTITAGPGATSGPNPEFDFTSDPTGATFECELSPSETSFTPCTSPKTYANLPAVAPPGYRFQVRARSAQGAVDATPAQQQFVVVLGPTIVITSPTNNATVGTSVPLTFNVETGVTYTCQLDSQAPIAPCTPGHVFSGLTSAVNPHTFKVTGTDSSSRTASQTVTVTVDDMGPGTAITANPTNGTSTNSTQATFSVTPIPANEPSPTFTCTLDSVAVPKCAAGYAPMNLAGGPHVFSARATDQLGNVGPVATVSWTIVAEVESVYYTRTSPVPVQTLVTIQTPQLMMTAKGPDRFWMQEGTNPYEGITVSPTTSTDAAVLVPGRVLIVTGIVDQVHGNLTLTHASYTAGALGTPYDPIYANRDVNQLFIESNEGMLMGMSGENEACSTDDFCIQSCETANPLINATNGTGGSVTIPSRGTNYSGIVEGASATSYTYYVATADDESDACL